MLSVSEESSEEARTNLTLGCMEPDFLCRSGEGLVLGCGEDLFEKGVGELFLRNGEV